MPLRMIAFLVSFAAILFCRIELGCVKAQENLPKFQSVTIDDDIGNVCYAVLAVDVDGDKQVDIVAVTENRVLWYKSPGRSDVADPTKWKKFVIIENQTERDNVCIAAYDIDRDGKIDFALGAGWTKKGTLQWLQRGQSLDEKWNVHEIGAEAWLHRMSFADVLGKGRAQLVISPLNKTKSPGVRLTAFEIPEKPETSRWNPVIVNQQDFDRLHNHTHFRNERDGNIQTLVANKSGTIVVSRKGQEWNLESISDLGAGEVKRGRVGEEKTFVATIEPMHGQKVAVYWPQKKSGEKMAWRRQEIENELAGGHALIAQDLDQDGVDELIVGHRLKGKGKTTGPGLYIYQMDTKNTAEGKLPAWRKTVLDNGGIAVEDATCLDVDGDGDPDIVAGGRGTRNLKLFLNQAK